MRRYSIALCVLILNCIHASLWAHSLSDQLVFVGQWDDDELASIENIWKSLPARVRRAGRFRITKSVSVLEKLIPFYDESKVQLSVNSNDYNSRHAYLRALRRSFVSAVFSIYDDQYDVSAKYEWRKISGWEEELPLSFLYPDWLNPPDNQDPRAYAARYGLRSAKDDFASFAAHYFDPDPIHKEEESLICRAPRKYQFFKSIFPATPSPLAARGIRCQSVDEGFLRDIQFFHPITRQPLDLGPINAETVKGFELLYATPGVGEMAEVAGHLLLRIKLDNNPQAERLGIQNPYDIVVSFLADTGTPLSSALEVNSENQCADEQSFFDAAESSPGFDPLASTLQALKGLSGGFLTTFDRNTLFATVYNYTVLQDRNLLRYELILTEQEKKSLLDRLFVAYKNYKSRYYFFDRNCASILVQIISEGLGRRDLVQFRPIVAPPNSLVALFRREGLAKPVYPAFYGYRKEAQIAQTMIWEELTKMRGHVAPYDQDEIPSREALFAKSEGSRLKAWKRLMRLSELYPELRAAVVNIARLQQVSEKLYLDREEICSPFTSKVISSSRSFILSNEREVPLQRLDHSIQLAHLSSEKAVVTTGSRHTRLLSVYAGAVSVDSEVGFNFGLSLHRQDMGDISSHAMQRTSEVALGHMEVSLSANRNPEIINWRITGLKVRKFRDELDRAPTIFSPSRTFGIGLSLLDYQDQNEASEMTWGGGEMLFSLASSSLNDRYLYLSTGVNVKSVWQDEVYAAGLGMPIYLHGLWTIDAQRYWQVRAHAGIEPFVGRGLPKYFTYFGSSVFWRISSYADHEWLVFLGAKTSTLFRQQYRVGVELNRW